MFIYKILDTRNGDLFNFETGLWDKTGTYEYSLDTVKQVCKWELKRISGYLATPRFYAFAHRELVPKITILKIEVPNTEPEYITMRFGNKTSYSSSKRFGKPQPYEKSCILSQRTLYNKEGFNYTQDKGILAIKCDIDNLSNYINYGNPTNINPSNHAYFHATDKISLTFAEKKNGIITETYRQIFDIKISTEIENKKL